MDDILQEKKQHVKEDHQKELEKMKKEHEKKIRDVTREHKEAVSPGCFFLKVVNDWCACSCHSCDFEEVWGCFLMSAVRRLLFAKDWWNSFKFTITILALRINACERLFYCISQYFRVQLFSRLTVSVTFLRVVKFAIVTCTKTLVHTYLD